MSTEADSSERLPRAGSARRLFGAVYGALGTLFGALSVVKLIEHGFASRFSATVALLLERYDALVSLLFGWAEPLIARAVAAFAGFQIAVQPHWKHVAVLLALYFSRNVAVTWRARGPVSALVRALWAVLVAGVTSVGVGLLPVAAQDLQANFLLAFLPLVGVSVFDLGNDVWGATWFRPAGTRWLDYFRFEAGFVLARAVVGALLIVGALAVPQVAALRSPGLAVLCILVVVLALYWIWLGTLLPARNRSGDSWRANAGRRGAWQLGWSMLACIGGALLFVVVDTGARFLP